MIENTDGRNMTTAAPHREHWSEHQTTMFSSLHEKQKQGKFCDVILKCSDSDKTYNAHSCVLSSASTVLDALLNDAIELTNTVPRTSKILLTLPEEVASSCMDSLLNFIYSGNIDLKMKNGRSDSRPSIKRTRRHSSKFHNPEDRINDDPLGPDIPLLYAFLRASRRLGIQTLTEHLESAVTLSEMKMSDAREASSTSTSSTKKLQSPAKTCERESRNLDEPDLGRLPVDATIMGESHRGRVNQRLPSKTGNKASFRRLLDGEGMRDLQVKTLHSGLLNTCINNLLTSVEEKQINESAKLVNKIRVIKKLQCPICETVFKSAKAYEVHMKNHISEIEEAMSRNKQKKSVTSSCMIQCESRSETVDNRTSTRPKRASTIKFHEMMKTTFKVDHISHPIVKKDAPIPSVEHILESESFFAPVLTELQNSSDVFNKQVTQEIMFEERTPNKSDVVNQDATNWSVVEGHAILEDIKEDNGHGVQEVKAVEMTKTRQEKKKARKIKKSVDDSEKCDDCGKSVLNMKTHRKIHLKPLPCPICGDTFKYRSALKRHMKFHNDGLSCSICQEKIFSQREMTRHMTKHNHKKMRTECPDCKRTFTSEYVMQLHRRTHTGEEKFVCTICKKKFPYKSSLKMHMLLHTGEKPYICSICGKSFVQKIHAREHEMQHQGYKREFECPICEKIFAHKCGLTRHIADIHKKSRPYICDKCGKTFPRKTKLTEHTRMHTGEKPYICDICGARYKANRSLKFHKKKEHDILVRDYEVGIWRKGPVPPPPEQSLKLTKVKKRTKLRPNGGDFAANKNLPCFPFPLSSEENNIPRAEERLVTDIAREHCVTIPMTTNEEKGLPDFPPPVASSQPFHTQFNPPTEVFSLPTLQPTSPSRKPDSSSTLDDSAFATQKTFLVPLTNAAHPSVSIMTEPNLPHVEQPPVSGMVMSYLMSPQPYIIAEAPSDMSPISDDSVTQLSVVSRSASVPPMSTFSKTSCTNVNQKPDSPIQVLPGMHTFKTGLQFRVSPNNMDTEIIEIESPAEVPSIGDMHQLTTVSPSDEVPTLAGEVTVHQQPEEWSIG